MHSPQSIRTRFAPSPTGYLHIGGARTALFNYLFAKKYGGTFILRIEDTDLERSTTESAEAILESLQWLNLQWDEGPYFQSQRMERYRTVIDELLRAGHAYRCYCSKERLIELKNQQIKDKIKPRYDQHCRNLNRQDTNQPFVIRFRNPDSGPVVVNDLIRGTVTFDNHELDDLIIARSDGVPTYNLSCVVDDHDMKISHVIRGDDHLTNTPRQINIFTALGATPPQYAHLPMILGSDGQRLSKRHAAVNVLQYRDEGYLPDALINYLVRLGWAHGDQEIFTRKEMIELFNIQTIHKSAAAFDPKKLLWLNQHYLKTTEPQQLVPAFTQQLQNLGIPYQEKDVSHSAAVIKALVERNKTLKEMAENSRYFYETPQKPAESDINKYFIPEVLKPLATLCERLSQITSWTPENIHAVIVETAEENQLPLGKLAQPIRLAVTGGTTSPPIDQTLYLIGQTQAVHRIKQILAHLTP